MLGSINPRVAASLDSDEALLAECEVQTYRASGPGGQNRNKVETAVRLRHRPTGITVIAEESRSQAENRARALRRLRRALALRVRSPLPPDEVPAAVRACVGGDGRLRVSGRDRRYLPACSAVLDLLLACEGSVSAAAARIGVSTANLSDFLTADGELLAEANRIRASFRLRPLRPG